MGGRQERGLVALREVGGKYALPEVGYARALWNGFGRRAVRSCQCPSCWNVAGSVGTGSAEGLGGEAMHSQCGEDRLPAVCSVLPGGRVREAAPPEVVDGDYQGSRCRAGSAGLASVGEMDAASSRYRCHLPRSDDLG